jgi:ABC-2 type transport system permease protein
MTLFFRQFRAELVKLFARKRTWMGFGAFFVLELLIWFLLRTEKVQNNFRAIFQRNGAFGGAAGVFDDYFRGLTLAMLIVMFTVFLLGGLFLALVGGDIVSKEVEDGTLRMTLCRPVSRVRVLAVKYLTCIAYTFALVLYIAGTALLVGLAWRGMGGLFIFVPDEQVFAVFEQTEGTWRFAAALVFYAAALVVVSSLAFMFSCFNAKPAAATVITLTIFLADRILYMWPQFSDYRHWFISAHINTWMNLFRDPIPWMKIVEDYLYLFGVNATCVIIGIAVFCRRDFKS